MTVDGTGLRGRQITRIVLDSIVWAGVVLIWEAANGFVQVWGLLLGAGLSTLPSWVHHMIGHDTAYALFAAFMVALPYVILGGVSWFIGLFEGLTGLGPRPFLAGSSLGLLVGGVLVPRLLEFDGLTHLVPQAALAGLVIVLAQAAGVFVSNLGTAPNKRFEPTP